MSILKRKVSIDCFYEYCKKGCPFFEEDYNKHKFYCHIDKISIFISWKKRIICKFNEKDKKAINIKIFDCEKELKKKTKEHTEEEYKDFSDGFSDCMNGKPIKDKANKSYIEGYTKAKLL